MKLAGARDWSWFQLTEFTRASVKQKATYHFCVRVIIIVNKDTKGTRFVAVCKKKKRLWCLIHLCEVRLSACLLLVLSLELAHKDTSIVK